MSQSATSSSPGFRDCPARPLEPGEVIASTYAIRDEIARTETGVVFEARDMMLDRIVAVKVAWRDPGVASLIVEARRCAAVKHPCSIAVHGMGMHDGTEYVVAERVTGTLLRDAIDRLAPEPYLQRLRSVVAAVAKAHEGQIAVGEISGSTVLLAREGRLVLGRLSLSQVPAFGPHGQLFAPEIARGEVAPDDPSGAEAIDLYGIGCVAIEMASGAPPFADADREITAQRHALELPPRLTDLRPDLPHELSDLVDWLLAKEPAARPRSAQDVLIQLDAVHERAGNVVGPMRILIVDDDLARARWLWSLARRAHSATIVEIASEGSDAAHKLNRDQPDLVFIDAKLRGVMNALELCMYARGLESHRSQMYLVGAVSERDGALFAEAQVQQIPDDNQLANAILDCVRTAVTEPKDRRKARTTISG